jgi:hypothetical protein
VSPEYDRDMSGESPWLSLTEAAQRSGISREAIRARARRGLIPSRKGNGRETLVQLPPGSVHVVSGNNQDMSGSPTDLVADLLAEVAELREQLAVTRAERDIATGVAKAEVAVVIERAAALRELADRLTTELAEARAQIAEANRPWWRRWRV